MDLKTYDVEILNRYGFKIGLLLQSIKYIFIVMKFK